MEQKNGYTGPKKWSEVTLAIRKAKGEAKEHRRQHKRDFLAEYRGYGDDREGKRKKKEFNLRHGRYGAGKVRPHRAKDFKTWEPERQTKYLENRRYRLQTKGMSKEEKELIIEK